MTIATAISVARIVRRNTVKDPGFLQLGAELIGKALPVDGNDMRNIDFPFPQNNFFCHIALLTSTSFSAA